MQLGVGVLHCPRDVVLWRRKDIEGGRGRERESCQSKSSEKYLPRQDLTCKRFIGVNTCEGNNDKSGRKL